MTKKRKGSLGKLNKTLTLKKAWKAVEKNKLSGKVAEANK